MAQQGLLTGVCDHMFLFAQDQLAEESLLGHILHGPLYYMEK